MTAFAPARPSANRLRDFALVSLLLIVALQSGLPALRALAQDSGGGGGSRTVLTNAFTYQGRLVQDGVPANGSFDLEFALFDVASGGSALVTLAVIEDVPVANGEFSVPVDFGLAQFTGDERWLEVRARAGASTGTFATVGRQLLTATPYALHAKSAADLVLPYTKVVTDFSTLPLLSITHDYGGQEPSSIVVASSTFGLQGTGKLAGLWGKSLETSGTGVLGQGPGAGLHGDSPLVGVKATSTTTGVDAGGGVTGVLAYGNQYGVDAFGLTIGSRGITNGPGTGVYGQNNAANYADSYGVYGKALGGTGVAGEGPVVGVKGISPAIGVLGTGATGVKGEGAPGVLGTNASTGIGVQGTSTSGTGVRGEGPTGVHGSGSSNGVQGFTTAGLGSGSGVYGEATNGGYGVYGKSLVPGPGGTQGGRGVEGEGWAIGVIGRSSAPDGYGLYGSGKAYGVFGTADSYGVEGTGAVIGVNGYGAGDGVRGTTSTLNKAGVSGIAAGGANNNYAGYFVGNVHTEGTITATGVIGPSDARLKHNVTPLSSGLAAILQLRPVHFAWLDGHDANRAHPGFIAQEVREVLPEVVYEQSDEMGTLALNSSELIPVLVAAIQELEARLAALEAAAP